MEDKEIKEIKVQVFFFHMVHRDSHSVMLLGLNIIRLMLLLILLS